MRTGRPQRLAAPCILAGRVRMNTLGENSRADPKPLLRNAARAARRALTPEVQSAERLMLYVSARDELGTHDLLQQLLAGDRTVAVPYCDGDVLRLARLRSTEELALGAFNIPEPVVAVRRNRDRAVDVAEIELFVVPGVAFDRRGARLGHGAGHFDRLLAGASPAATVWGLAFACQVFAEVPLLPHDVQVQRIVTEDEVIDCLSHGPPRMPPSTQLPLSPP
jgi:5-formyltetrahydrofolate cyclo-ligase